MRALEVAAIVLASVISTPSVLIAEQRYYYDSNGNSVGSSMSAGQNTFYYNSQGQDIGSSMRAGNNTYYYDTNGNSIGSSMGGLSQD